MIQNTHESILELLENVLFSIVLNHNPLSSGNVVNSSNRITKSTLIIQNSSKAPRGWCFKNV